MTKFPVKVYTMNGHGYGSTHDYYEMTEEELENKCCILECRIYFKDTVCNSYKCLIDQPFVTLYTIWNYDYPWWEWPQELKEVMYKKVPESRPSAPSILDPSTCWSGTCPVQCSYECQMRRKSGRT